MVSFWCVERFFGCVWSVWGIAFIVFGVFGGEVGVFVYCSMFLDGFLCLRVFGMLLSARRAMLFVAYEL